MTPGIPYAKQADLFPKKCNRTLVKDDPHGPRGHMGAYSMHGCTNQS